MLLTITKTPKSITILDSDRNRITVVKTATGIELHSAIENGKRTNTMLELQRKIGQIVVNPKNNRDNYKVRFDRLAKIMTDLKTASFLTVKNEIAKIDEI